MKKQGHKNRLSDNFDTFMKKPDEYPIVLGLPNASLTQTFGKEIGTSNAPMTTLNKFEKPSRNIHKKFHYFKTSDQHDFSQKLTRLRKAGLTKKLFLECNSYVKSYSQSILPDNDQQQDFKQTREKELTNISTSGKKGSGVALHVSEDLIIGFPVITFENSSTPKIEYPVIDKQNYTHISASTNQPHNEEYSDYKMFSANTLD